MKNDQVQVRPASSDADLARLVPFAEGLKATHVHILQDGGKRAHVVPLKDLVRACAGLIATVTFGRKSPGLPFERMSELPEDEETTPPAPAPAKPAAVKATTAPAPEKAAPAKRRAPTPIRVQNTGYMAFIDTLLEDVDGKGADDKGFPRSRHTVDAAVRLVLAKFPGKNPGSVRRVVKVRPRHLERAKTIERYDDNKNRAPRWGWVGPGAGTGFMRRVDQLLIAGKHTTRQIAEITSREFGRDEDAALTMIRIRPSHLKRFKGIKAEFKRVKPERLPGQKSKRQLTKEHNQRMLAAKRAVAA